MSLWKQPSKLAMLVVLLLLLCHAVDKVHCSTHHNNSQDFHSLLEFHKGITSDPNEALSNWNPSIHFCHWHGVNCSSTRPYRVTELNLTGQNLAGQISSSLGNLTFLHTLDLSYNSFSGPLPLLNKLRNLDILFLGSNHLGDVIPDWLTNSSNLVDLDLSENNLNGHIPSNIGFLTKLEGIVLSNNNLTGVIPPTLGNISTLGVVDFSVNQLSGSIPNKVWQIPNITVLSLAQNNLSGGIPDTLSNLSSLTSLGLNNNKLGSALPSNIGDVFPHLNILYLDNNIFVGTIPSSLGNPSSLEALDLSNNHFSGKIPSSFGRLSKLQILNLERNMLEARDSEGWQFFDALANCSSLNTLSVSQNLLHGPIPNSISNLSTTLQYLMMALNNLSGTVPPTIGKFSGLIKLSLANNNLTGTIEEWVGNMTKLQILRLQSNNFKGKIPPSIGNLTGLTHFYVGDNNFSGSIPSNLWNLNITILDLSHNNFQGSIPVQFSNLELISLNLSSNKFSGEIPETLGQLKQIQIIQMDQNILTGDIPSTFSSLYSLDLLNLSHNNLYGPLPSFLSGLNLSKLDLSYNNFQGKIPTTGVFDNPKIVSLDGNPGLCGGAMDLHMPPCNHASRRAGKANLLIKILIPIFGFMSLVLLVYFLVLEKRTSRRAYRSEQTYGEHFEKVTYNDLAQATRDFSESNLIGRGSYGSVYRGKLKESKIEVAVKVFDLEMRGAERSFLSECEALRRIQHRNLLPIITACSTVDNVGNVFKALIYEFMPNGSLDTWLHHKGDNEAVKRLGLTQRISIAVNIADALDYLHHDCGRPTVHCDLKPSNILLDDDMNALLGDFGIARFYHDPESKWAGSISSIGVKGTIGYIPPEYGGGGLVSTSGDVYSFGILLLEILTCKRPTDPLFKDDQDIISFVENNFPDHVFQVIDSHLLEECRSSIQGNNSIHENEINQCLVDLLQVGLSCLRSLPSERSNMKQVASRMHAIQTSHIGWKHK
ncbi:Receptor kinase-like protein Xa21 [Zea mays]|uniref:Receptor kinase-like protein Xa21 n=1 Tax=Zea mays TaxID=4577 RepID=A0A3L6FBR2_MAIZE|nr:Receptor kinase-like protein Xa21 [Zea mays]PWZ29792.1 Receptor kinase-like protein Xa21 [Zea mays]